MIRMLHAYPVYLCSVTFADVFSDITLLYPFSASLFGAIVLVAAVNLTRPLFCFLWRYFQRQQDNKAAALTRVAALGRVWCGLLPSCGAASAGRWSAAAARSSQAVKSAVSSRGPAERRGGSGAVAVVCCGEVTWD